MKYTIFSLPFTSLALWIAQACFFICFIPQVWLNFREKTGEGISDLMMMAYMNGQVGAFIYIFCLNLPFVFKIMTTLAGGALSVLIIQRFYYAVWSLETQKIFAGYVINGVFLFCIALQAKKSPLLLGNLAGWGIFFLSLIQQIPQIIKIHKARSTKGFSYAFILICSIGNIIEFITGLIIHLPIQTLLADLRGIIMFIIFSIQFWLYRKR